MINNIKETVSFPVYMLASKQLPGNLITAIQSYENDPQSDHLNTAVKLAPDWFQEELSEMGLTVVSSVPIHMTVGTVLFDLYIQHVNPPKAPLANALFVMKRTEIAEVLSNETFIIPQVVFDTAKVVLGDDSLWNKARLSAVYQKDDNTGIAFEIKASGLSSYKEIMAELINAFLG